MKYANAKNYRRAIESFTEAIDLNLQREASYHDRGNCYLLTHDLNRAAADYKMAVQLSPKNVTAQYQLGEALYQMNDRRGAIAAQRKAIQLQPDAYAPHNGIAWILATSPDAAERNGKQAIAEAQLACKYSHWKYPPCIDTLAAAYAEAGQFDEAIKQQQRALELLKTHKTFAAEPRIYRQHLDLLLHHQPIRSSTPPTSL